MTDEEKQIFEEWFEEKKEKCEVYGNGDDFWVDDEIKKFCLMGYEQGLKAGRPQWHKEPNDLPKEKGDILVLADWGLEKPCYGLASWDGQTFKMYADIKVIAWCEIPTFNKE